MAHTIKAQSQNGIPKSDKAASARANTKKLTAKAGVASCKRKCIRSRFPRESLYFPGCPGFISKSSSAHACRTLRNEELRKTHESGAHQAQQRGNEMAGLGHLMVGVLSKEAAHLDRAESHVQPRVDREDHVCEPIHQIEDRVPVKVGIIPAQLACKFLHRAQQTRYQQAKNATIGPGRIDLVLSPGELEDRNRNE